MKKTRPLPATDLAEQCLRPEEQQWQYLRRLNRAGRGGKQGSYEPMRRTSPDILNVQPPMFGALPPTPWEEIENLITRRGCWNDMVRQKNLLVGRSLYDHVNEAGITGRRLEDPPRTVPIGLMGIQTKFWENTAIVRDRRIGLVFLDLRRKFGLSELGRRVIYSLMHEVVRAGYAEYAAAKLLVYQFADDESRTINVCDADVERLALLSFDQLEAATARTYEIWIAVQAEGDEDASGGGDPGPLFGGKSA